MRIVELDFQLHALGAEREFRAQAKEGFIQHVPQIFVIRCDLNISHLRRCNRPLVHFRYLETQLSHQGDRMRNYNLEVRIRDIPSAILAHKSITDFSRATNPGRMIGMTAKIGSGDTEHEVGILNLDLSKGKASFTPTVADGPLHSPRNTNAPLNLLFFPDNPPGDLVCRNRHRVQRGILDGELSHEGDCLRDGKLQVNYNDYNNFPKSGINVELTAQMGSGANAKNVGLLTFDQSTGNASFTPTVADAKDGRKVWFTIKCDGDIMLSSGSKDWSGLYTHSMMTVDLPKGITKCPWE
ncbi:hypothetical protein T439DRAFT_331460 [Meredithblackwellia eburnea MCA 4105]